MTTYLIIRRISLSILFLISAFYSYALIPEINEKMGKPTQEELEMSTYDLDENADALVLMEKCEVDYQYVGSKGFVIVYKVSNRIKILTEEGTRYGDISIPYSYIKGHHDLSDEIRNIKAASYNLEDGKIKKNEVDKKLIFEEQIIGSSYLKKFSIPNVKIGSIIEYSYEIWSGLILSMRPWGFQHDIPALYVEHSVIIPEYFQYKVEAKGYEKIYVKEEIIPIKFSFGSGHLVDCNARSIISKGFNLPAIKGDDYLYCLDDYTTKITFEISGMGLPGQRYHSFTVNSWKEYDNSLLASKFGDNLKIKNPYKKENDKPIFEGSESISEKITELANYVSSKMKWNKSYTLISESIEDEVKASTGSSATMNFILMSLLRDYGITCFPVALRTRDYGMMSLTHIYPDVFNTFIVGFYDENNTIHFIDCSNEFGGVDVISSLMNVKNGRIISEDLLIDNKWVSLQDLSKNTMRRMSVIEFDQDSLKCKTTFVYTGNYANQVRKQYAEKSDSLEFVFTDLNRDLTQLQSISFEAMTGRSPKVRYDYEYKMPIDIIGDEIYINPIHLVDVTENPFIDETRKYPIEFPFSHEDNVKNTITIPEGYEVAHIPESINIKTEDGAVQLVYNIKESNGTINVTYRVKIGSTFFTSEMYPQIKQIYDLMVDKGAEPIILKKKI